MHNRCLLHPLLRLLVSGAPIILETCADLFFRCLSARRRRKHGYNPYFGTGWTVRHGTPTYNQNVQPQYETTSTPYYNNSNNPPPGTIQYDPCSTLRQVLTCNYSL